MRSEFGKHPAIKASEEDLTIKTPEELKEAKKIAGVMSEKESKAMIKEVLEREKEIKKIDKLAEDINLSLEVREIIKNCHNPEIYDPRRDSLVPNESDNLTEAHIFELIEKWPKLRGFDMCYMRNIASERIVEKFFERFPEGRIGDFNRRRDEIWHKYFKSEGEPINGYKLVEKDLMKKTKEE
jgi:hypothetical protein